MLAHNTCWICTTKSENRPITLFLLLLACYSHSGIDVKLMSIHHCLSLKLPVVADIKINGVLQPFTANQLETQIKYRSTFIVDSVHLNCHNQQLRICVI